jgi:hypothetical protein
MALRPTQFHREVGHANVTVTLDTYSHVLPHMQDGAVAATESSLS